MPQPAKCILENALCDLDPGTHDLWNVISVKRTW